MDFKLGQKVKYRKVAQKTTRYIEEKEFDDEEIISIDKIKMVELAKERTGFIVGVRYIAKKSEYTFEGDDPDGFGTIVWSDTETIKVYKVAYDMAHGNYVLEEDLKRGIKNK